MTLRVITDGTYSEPVQQALERVLADKVAAGDIGPTLRVWYRDAPAVPIGRFQSYEDEVATDYVERHDIDVVRRATGGGAMYVEPGAVLTYSLYLPPEDVPDDVADSYVYLDQWAIDALQAVGIDASYEPLNDIVHADGKLGGAAQLRTDGAVLHHTTMSYDLDIERMLRVLRIGEEKLSDKAVASAEKRVAVMTDHTDASRATIVDALVAAIGDTFETRRGSLSAATLEAARTLAAEQFDTAAWTRKL
uniref:lipoate--protein ligase family protein n=1 Tax=Halobacterium sp. (strain GN101) TaxID=88773 RepID=UPI00159ECD1B|nr:biotin/lipoate A/B protein ligase family protein [Halobacterium sp. GN101]